MNFLIKVKYANIINIMQNKEIIPELINNKLNSNNLIYKFEQLINDFDIRNNQILPSINSINYNDNTSKCQIYTNSIYSEIILSFNYFCSLIFSDFFLIFPEFRIWFPVDSARQIFPKIFFRLYMNYREKGDPYCSTPVIL